ncbi:unnamed protein product [Ectocarpus sp. 6 AP-2014]
MLPSESLIETAQVGPQRACGEVLTGLAVVGWAERGEKHTYTCPPFAPGVHGQLG